MRLLLFLLSISFVLTATSQKKDTTFSIHYHSNKKISTKEVKLTNDLNWGYAKAFDRNGKEIYLMHTRNVAGHSSVDFYYYPSGAVEKAHFSSHPDGGIQWSDITHYFDENGNVTSVIDNSSDEFGHFRLNVDPTLFNDTVKERDVVPVVKKENPKKEEVIACAEIYSTDFYLINATGKKRTYTARLLNAPIEGMQKQGVIFQNDTIHLGSYIEAQLFTHPKERFSLEIKGNKSEKFNLFWEEPKQDGKSKRSYYLIAVKQ